MVAVIKLAIVPANTAFKPNLASSDFLEGANPPIPPICIAMDEKFAKPQRAKVAIAIVLGPRLIKPLLRLILNKPQIRLILFSYLIKLPYW